MADPLGIAIAPDDDTFEPDPSWTILDGGDKPWRLNGFDVSRGRSSELDRTEGGTATLSLTDLDGTLDPTMNPSDSPLINPMVQAAIRVQNPVTSEWRYLFKGFVSEHSTDLYPTGRLATSQVELIDGFGILGSLQMVPTVPATFGGIVPIGTSGQIYFEPTTGDPETGQVRQRILEALDDANWPRAWTHIFSGNVKLLGNVYSRREDLLSVLRDAADAEFPGVANIYMSRRGTVVFHGRYARFNPEAYEAADDDLREGPAGTGGRIRFWKAGGRPQAEDDPTVAVISNISWRRSWNDVINAALALPKFFEENLVPGQLYKDNASISQYGWRMAPQMDGLLVRHGDTPPGRNSLEETKLYAEYYVENYKQPKTRLTRLQFRTRDVNDDLAPALWGFICGVEIGDVVTVTTTHFDAGGFDEDYYVEGIRYNATNLGRTGLEDITMELDVSPRSFYDHNPWDTTVDDEHEVPE